MSRAIVAWDGVTGSGDILITGGVPEAWTPKKKRTEGCAECDWLRLNLSLYRATGDAKYLDTAENIYFNEFSMNQFSTGDFGHAVLNAQGTPGLSVRAWWCCTLHGLRTFADVQKSVFRSTANEIFYDLPLDGFLRNQTCSAQATSDLATNGCVHIRILEMRAPQPLAVTITQNGRKIPGLRVSSIKAGDRIEVKYTMSLRSDKVSENLGKVQRYSTSARGY